MKTVVKAVTKRLAVDGWNRKFDSDFDMVIGETYLCHNKKIKHMLIPQTVLDKSDTKITLQEYVKDLNHLVNHGEILLDKPIESVVYCS